MKPGICIKLLPGSGIVVVACAAAPDMPGFIEALTETAGADDFASLVLFFAPDYDAQTLARRLAHDVPIPVQIGCSTAGEIGPFGIGNGGAVALLFPADRFCCVASIVTHISEQGFDNGTACAGALVEKLRESVGGEIEGSAFALTLIDGLSAREEIMVSAFQSGLQTLPHIGGSAGDGLAFREAWLIYNGEAYHDAALLCLFHSTVPFRVFKSDHFAPTDMRLVVTECDAEKRIVTEINGMPATREYAEVIGLDPTALSPMSFAAHPLVVRIGDDHFCRSIRRVEEAVLSFFCAIDNGVVLTLARSHDMAESVDRTLLALDKELGGTDMILGFDCILRRIEAENRGSLHHIADVYQRHNVVGFHTYGEQFKSMHVNQTFSGVAFGQGSAPKTTPESSLEKARAESRSTNGIVLGTCGRLGTPAKVEATVTKTDSLRIDPAYAERMRRLEKVNAALIAQAEKVTERRADAYALFQAAILLESQVQKRTDELLAAKRRLEASNREIFEAKEAAEIANRSKSKFLTAASHDLLQPLNAARLLVSALAETQLTCNGKQLVEQVDHALAMIGDLIKSVLDIGKLDAGAMVPEIETISLRNLLGGVASDFAPMAAQKHLRLSVMTPDLAVRSDPILLKRILSNLTSNAVRYTGSGGVLIGARRRGACVRIDVVDTGIGIPAQHSAAIFEEFSRGPAQSKDADGLGLGLAIVRRMAQALHHDLSFRSTESRGSVFSLLVPVAATEMKRDDDTVPSVPESDRLAGARLLLIENNQQTVEAMTALAELWQCQMKVANDIDSGIAPVMTRTFVPNIIIADYHLDNGVCGLDVVEAIRTMAGHDIPAIIATADYTPTVDTKVKARGLTLLKKPLRPADLRALITSLLS